jgi:hypothetical protein
MTGKLLGFDRMHENKKYIYFYFLKGEINLKYLIFFEKFQRKQSILIPDLYLTV